MKRRNLTTLVLLGVASGLLVNANAASADASSAPQQEEAKKTTKPPGNSDQARDLAYAESPTARPATRGNVADAQDGAQQMPASQPKFKNQQDFYNQLDAQHKQMFDKMTPAQQAQTLAAGNAGCKAMNSCKGMGGCKTSSHSCAGQNACKSQGGCKHYDANKAVDAMNSQMATKRTSLQNGQ